MKSVRQGFQNKVRAQTGQTGRQTNETETIPHHIHRGQIVRLTANNSSALELGIFDSVGKFIRIDSAQ